VLLSLTCKSKIRSQLAAEHGFALMEVVMTSVVLGIAVVGVALMLSSARSFTVAQGDERVAFYLAQEKMENLRIVNFSLLTAASPPPNPCPTGTNCYKEVLTAGEDSTQTFTRETTVSCVTKNNLQTPLNPCPASPVLKRITVTVKSLMRQVDPNGVTLETLLANPNP
jgi:Tfp pilus assembly protein PilV